MGGGEKRGSQSSLLLLLVLGGEGIRRGKGGEGVGGGGSKRKDFLLSPGFLLVVLSTLISAAVYLARRMKERMKKAYSIQYIRRRLYLEWPLESFTRPSDAHFFPSSLGDLQFRLQLSLSSLRPHTYFLTGFSPSQLPDCQSSLRCSPTTLRERISLFSLYCIFLHRSISSLSKAFAYWIVDCFLFVNILAPTFLRWNYCHKDKVFCSGKKPR